MKTAIAIRHLLFEDAGILAPLLQQRGYRLAYREAGIDSLEDAADADLLVVLGGPIGANDEAQYPFISDELATIETRLAKQRPTLGICLGGQLMARALGARVAPMGHKEIGFSPLQLTEGGQQSVLRTLADGTPVLHWHGDSWQQPEGATVLASSALCAQQAFAIDHFALALQFHLEADLQRIEQWLIGHATELGLAGIDPTEIRQQAKTVRERLHAAGARVFNDWLDGIG